MSSHARSLVPAAVPTPARRFLLRALTSADEYVVTRHERTGLCGTVRYTVSLAGVLLCQCALPTILDSEDTLDILLGCVAKCRQRALDTADRVEVPRPRLVRP